jgi:hypothetical protein
VEVAQPSPLDVEIVHHDRRLGVLAAVVGGVGVGQPEGVGLGGDHLARGQVLEGVVDQRAPDVQLLHVDAVQAAKLVVRRLEEGPLVALEVDGQHERHHGQRLAAERVHHLDPQIDVAVLLDPDAVVGVQGVPPVAGGIQGGEDGDAAHVDPFRALRPCRPAASSPCGRRCVRC